MMAFFAENYQTGEAISDPKYVQWVLRHVEMKGGVKTKTWHRMHVCTEDEFEYFSTPGTKEVDDKVSKLFKAGHIFCFDYKSVDWSLKGTES